MIFSASAGSRATSLPELRSGILAQPVTEQMMNVPSGGSTTVLVADPSGAMISALRPTLTEHGGYQVLHVRSTNAIDELVASGVRGHVAMVSVRFNGDTPGIIRKLCAGGWTRVIALTTRAESAPVVEAVQAGATGVVRVACLEPDPQPVTALSARELEVVRLVADGRSNKDIGVQLSLSALTVKNHLARIGRKMGAGDRAKIVAIACRGGLILDLVPTQQQ